MTRNRWASLVLVSVLLLLVLPPRQARGYNGALTQAYCEGTLNGNWVSGSSFDTCTIPSGNTGEVPSGDILTLMYETGPYNYQDIVVESGATLNVNGKLECHTGVLTNKGTLNVGAYDRSNGYISVQARAADPLYPGKLINEGTVTNNGLISAGRDGTVGSQLWNELGATFHNNGDVDISTVFDFITPGFLNVGTFNNNAGADFTVREGGEARNRGLFENDGLVTLYNYFEAADADLPHEGQHEFHNDVGGTIELWHWTGTPADNGYLYTDSGVTFTNDGTITVHDNRCLTWLHCGTNNGTITNDGEWRIENDFFNAATGVFTNQEDLYCWSGGRLHNDGLLVNQSFMATNGDGGYHEQRPDDVAVRLHSGAQEQQWHDHQQWPAEQHRGKHTARRPARNPADWTHDAHRRIRFDGHL